MVKVLKTNSCKYNNVSTVVVGRDLPKIEGFHCEK